MLLTYLLGASRSRIGRIARVCGIHGGTSGSTTALRETTAREPYPEILGPIKDRGTQNGIVVRGGYIVAEWGDTHRVDMTFSVAKSYLGAPRVAEASA